MKNKIITILYKMSNVFFHNVRENYDLEKRTGIVPEFSSYFNQNILDIFLDIKLYEKHLLEIEFLKELGDVEICFQNQYGVIVYELQTPTAPTLHIFIDINDFVPGTYKIQINNFTLKSEFTLSQKKMQKDAILIQSKEGTCLNLLQQRNLFFSIS